MALVKKKLQKHLFQRVINLFSLKLLSQKTNQLKVRKIKQEMQN